MLRRIACLVLSIVFVVSSSLAEDIRSAVADLPDDALIVLYSIITDELKSRNIPYGSGESQSKTLPITGERLENGKEILAELFSIERDLGYDPSYQLSPEDLVWISKNGKRFHTVSTCSNMKKPSTVTLASAKAKGLTPCNDCAYWLVETGE